MKLLLVLAVVAAALWLWRSGRSSVPARSAVAPTQAQDMIACGLCQVHVLAAEAIAGKRGRYCCTQHRQQAEP